MATNTLTKTCIPNHCLRLKVGVPVMLLRNIDQSSGLCNGTRLVVTRLMTHTIEAEIISATFPVSSEAEFLSFPSQPAKNLPLYASAMGFEDFEPIFGEVKAEWAISNPSLVLNPFMIHVFAADAFNLKFHVTDFQSSTWEAVRSTIQLDDMRDSIGIGGSWSDFMDYFISSLKCDDLKLILDGQCESNGVKSSKLVARKSKGMPLISISLSKLMESAAGEAMANLSLRMFAAFKDMRNALAKEQERGCQLTTMISAEKEKSQTLKSQLDSLVYSKRQKLDVMTSEKANMSVPNSDAPPYNGANNSSGKQEDAAVVKPTKVLKRVVPAHRRTKVRGAVLLDTGED